MQAYERERARKLRLALTGAGAVFATAGLAWFVVVLGEPDAPATARPIAATLPAPPVTVASAEPAPPPTPAVDPPPAPPAVAESQPAGPAVPVQAATPSSLPSTPAPAPQTAAAVPNDPPAATPPSAPAPAPPPLSREGIREVQKRLAGFGFNPGPIDGVAGRRTEEATQRYLETRGQPQMPPNDPQMLEQLRQDPAAPVAQPQTVQRPNGSNGRPAQSGQAGANQRRSFDPFEPVKVAGTEITRFFQSVFRYDSASSR